MLRLNILAASAVCHEIVNILTWRGGSLLNSLHDRNQCWPFLHVLINEMHWYHFPASKFVILTQFGCGTFLMSLYLQPHPWLWQKLAYITRNNNTIKHEAVKCQHWTLILSLLAISTQFLYLVRALLYHRHQPSVL